MKKVANTLGETALGHTLNIIGTALSVFLFLFLAACGGGGSGGSGTPPPGTLNLTVLDRTSGEGITEAQILLIDGETGDPIGNVLISDDSGTASVTLQPTSVLAKVSAQGFSPSPPSNSSPLPVQIVSGQTTEITINLYPLSNAGSLGLISGVYRNADQEGILGALVVANVGENYTSTTTDQNGSFVLHNVPEGTATITVWKKGFNFQPVNSIQVVAGQETSGLMLTAISSAPGSVVGQVSFLSIVNGIVDITIIHPKTGDVIPGLRAFNTNENTFSLMEVPNGDFNIIASLENDGYVLDPDSVVKFGIPSITVASNQVEIDFDVTGSISLTSPINNAKIHLPSTDIDLVFSWQPYPSASDYVVELVDESGQVVWGGFEDDGTKKITIPPEETSISFNNDDTATQSLEIGRFYQVRVYASKDDQKQILGFKLISSTETLDGVFQIVSEI